MKIILILGLLSTAASACPNLSGSYRSCAKVSGLRELPGIKITQSRGRTGPTTFELVSEDPYTGVEHRETIITDGEFREMDEGSDAEIKYKIAYRCEGELLRFEQLVEQNQNGNTVSIGIDGSVRKLGKKIVLEKSGSVVLDEMGRISVKPDPEVTLCE